MSFALRRTSSEYSQQSESTMAAVAKNLEKQTNIDKSEERKSQFMIYGMLFKEPCALVGIIPSIVSGAIPVFSQWLVGMILNALTDFYQTGENCMEEINKIMIYSAIVAIVTIICKIFDTLLWVRAGSRISVKIKDQIFFSIMKYDVGFFDVNPIGNILAVLGEDAAVIQECFGTTKSTQLQSLGQFFIGCIFCYVYTWKIGLIMTVMVPVIIFIMRAFHPAIERNAIKRFSQISLSITLADETIAAIRTVKGFNQEEKNMERFSDKNEMSATYDRNVTFLIVTMFTIVMLLMWGIVLACFYWAATMVGSVQNGKEFNIGELVSMFGFMLMGGMGLVQLQNSINAENRAIQAGARVMRLINYESPINFDGGETYEPFIGNIKFDHVSFQYPTREKLALIDVTFEVKAGETAALVGHSGSGKSTCVQLLERYYDIREGIIRIDGHDIRDLDPRWLHRQIGLVSQEPTLFQATIRENVLYGLRGSDIGKDNNNKDNGEDKTIDMSDEAVWNALESANAKKFVEKLDGQLNYMAGDRGNSLSGGQKQRIAIARAIIKNPKIMITDEATSALDTESEKKVQIALDRILETRTGVVVAHRLTTIKNSNIIYVFDAGRIVEQGSHSELISRRGAYYNLVFRQLSDEDKNKESAIESKSSNSSSGSYNVGQAEDEKFINSSSDND